MILFENLRVLLCLLTVCSIILVPMIFVGPQHSTQSASDTTSWRWQEFWLVRLALNLVGYGTVFAPCFLIVQYLKRVRYNERAGTGYVSTIIRLCVFGQEDSDPENPREEIQSPKHITSAAAAAALTGGPLPYTGAWYSVLLVLFLGLQASYLTWGVLQERIMTRDYSGIRFRDSQFLVFMNRVLAGVLAGVCLLLTPQPLHRAPLYEYGYFSFTNVLSSWCQYEALKYVSFPTQVLAKASKIIPVMLMGRIINRKSYRLNEYGTAGMISAGVAIFLLTSSENKHPEAVTTSSGVLLLVGYMMFDSFTSNYQSSLFRRYGVSSMQMMAAANFWSCLLTFTSLLEQGSLSGSIRFMLVEPRFAMDVVLLSVCGAVGQLFIYHTISRYGPVTFIIIMTMRQAFAILLSCLIYQHPVTPLGIFGVCVVFLAMFMRIYLNNRARREVKFEPSFDSSPNSPPHSVDTRR